MNKEFYENQVIQICSDYAAIAHMKQFRKDGKTPYISHPARVAALVAFFLKDQADWYIWVAAAWLHDVMEDCSELIDGEYSYNIDNHVRGYRDIAVFLQDHDVISTFDGKKILEAAEALTMSQDKSIPKKERKEDYYAKMIDASSEVVVIKYCDRIDNLITASIFSKGGFKWYITETEDMIATFERSRDMIRFHAYKMLSAELEAVKNKYADMYEEKRADADDFDTDW